VVVVLSRVGDACGFGCVGCCGMSQRTAARLARPCKNGWRHIVVLLHCKRISTIHGTNMPKWGHVCAMFVEIARECHVCAIFVQFYRFFVPLRALCPSLFLVSRLYPGRTAYTCNPKNLLMPVPHICAMFVQLWSAWRHICRFPLVYIIFHSIHCLLWSK
jgi:hypothetical protein